MGDDPRTEQEVWTGRYSAKALTLHFVGLSLWAILVLSLAASFKWGFWVWALLIFIPLGAVLVRLAYGKLTIRYRLTTQRFFHTYGLLVQRTDEVELMRIDDVTVEQNIIERISNIGTLTIHSTDKSEPKKTIAGISNPKEVKEHIRSYAVQLRRGVVRVHDM